MKNYVLICLALLAGSLLLAQEHAAQFNAADQSVSLLPTAHTMPRGTHAITTMEFVLFQYSYAPTNRLHLSAMMMPLFILVDEEAFRTLTVGAKYRYLSKREFDSAAWVSYSPVPKLLTVGNVMSMSLDKTSMHIVAGFTSRPTVGRGKPFVGLGGIAEISHRLSLVGEVSIIPDGTVLYEEDNEDMEVYSSILILGLRLKGGMTCWDLGGVVSLEGKTSVAPFIKATFCF